MKKLILILPILFIIYSCAVPEDEPKQMVGVFQMQTQSFKGENMDTTITTGQQLKIFNGEHIMYARFNPTDSLSAFGVGSYSTSANMDTITENIFFSSYDSLPNETPRTYNLHIEKTLEGYNQIIPAIENPRGGTYKLTEEYESTGTGETSPLEGLWKLTHHYSVRGKDTTHTTFTQYKIFYDGHFIWGRSYTDSLNKNRTAIGYGKLVTTGDGKLTETVLSSTLPAIREHDFDISFELKGEDGYRQIFQDSEGFTIIEDYERVKKKEKK